MSLRLTSVVMMSLSSGMPLGLVWTALPAFLAMSGVDIKTIGVMTLAQTPYAFKFAWAPLCDRFRIPPGNKRGWIAVMQLALAALTGLLAAHATEPTVGAVAALTLLIAFASATQDIAIDAYAVDALEKSEQGVAVGARTAMYRVGMWLSGNIAISVAPMLGWDVTLALLAGIYVLMLPLTLLAPEPAQAPPPPRSLRQAVWEPFVGFLQKARAVEITAFLFLYKLADNLAGALVRPFLVQVGFTAVDVGVASGTIGLFGTMLGTFVGGALTGRLGVGRALWVFGVLQAVSNVGYAAVAMAGPDRLVMYGAMAVESLTSGLGTGAFGVLLFRLTEKRFSATQYALFSSVFALGRTLVGPVAGALAFSLGWRDFFLLSIACAAPGLVMLQRFVPWTARDIPDEPAAARVTPQPVARGTVASAGALAAVAATSAALITNAALAALKAARAGTSFDWMTTLARMLAPTELTDAADLFASVVFGLVMGLAVAAYLLARRGVQTP